MPSRAPISSIARSSAAASPKRSQPATPASIAQAIVPPVEIVSSPSSSQRALACSTSSASSMPTSGPSANTLSYSTRAIAARAVLRSARSRSSTTRRSRARRPGPRARASVVSPPKLRPGSAESALNVSRFVSVPALAVLRRRGAERARAQVLRRGEHRAGLRDRALARRPHGDGLQALGAHDRAEPAAAGVAAVVRDGRVAHQALTGRADRGDPVGGSEPRAQPRLRLGGGEPPEVGGVDEPAPSPSTTSADGVVAGAADDDRIVAGQLAGDREVARRERVVEAVGERRLRDHGELRAGGQRRADERREDERERRLGRERVDAGRRELPASGTCRARRRRAWCAARVVHGNVVALPSSRSTTSALPK